MKSPSFSTGWASFQFHVEEALDFFPSKIVFVFRFFFVSECTAKNMKSFTLVI